MFNAVLAELASRTSDWITVGEILEALGDRAFGTSMLVFAAPNALPMPPGVSAVLGAPLLFITAGSLVLLAAFSGAVVSSVAVLLGYS